MRVAGSYALIRGRLQFASAQQAAIRAAPRPKPEDADRSYLSDGLAALTDIAAHLLSYCRSRRVRRGVYYLIVEPGFSDYQGQSLSDAAAVEVTQVQCDNAARRRN
jgi:hypothetical protein